MFNQSINQECVTQSMVDRHIMEEIREFLAGILANSYRHSRQTFNTEQTFTIVSITEIIKLKPYQKAFQTSFAYLLLNVNLAVT